MKKVIIKSNMSYSEMEYTLKSVFEHYEVINDQR